MKKSNVITLFAGLIAAMLVAGCQTPAPVAAPVVKAAPDPIVFTAQGESVADAADAVSVAKARLAAATIAKANLLELIKGAVISSSVNVEDLAFVSQQASATMKGWLARATVEIDDLVDPEPSRLSEPAVGQQIVTATATLELSEGDLAALQDVVE